MPVIVFDCRMYPPPVKFEYNGRDIKVLTLAGKPLKMRISSKKKLYSGWILTLFKIQWRDNFPESCGDPFYRIPLSNAIKWSDKSNIKFKAYLHLLAIRKTRIKLSATLSHIPLFSIKKKTSSFPLL